MKKGADDTRAIALEILLSWEKGLKEGRGIGSCRPDGDGDIHKAYQKASDIIGGALAKYGWMEKRDRGFIKNIAEGTIERLLTLDYVIDRFSRIKAAKLKPIIRMIIRMGAYQLLFLPDIPKAAVCNEAVKLAKHKHFDGLSGYVNGVLRSIGRSNIGIDSIEELPYRYSMPEWIVDRLLKTFGQEKTVDILKASLGRRPLFIRVNVTRTDRERLMERLIPEGAEALIPDCSSLQIDLPFALELKTAESPGALPSFREGLFSVQDLSSMAVGALASPKEGERVLDLCAAPGGKACHIAELLSNSGYVEARDISPARAESISENKERLGLENIRVEISDALEEPRGTEEKFDIVLADLPCSGLGVMGRRNDLKYRVKPEDIPSLQALQRKILQNALRYLKAGGRLVYSVCTITEEETVEQSRWIEENLRLHRDTERLFLPEAGGMDGFYVAIFKAYK